jgi:hypothetical protein
MNYIKPNMHIETRKKKREDRVTRKEISTCYKSQQKLTGSVTFLLVSWASHCWDPTLTGNMIKVILIKNKIIITPNLTFGVELELVMSSKMSMVSHFLCRPTKICHVN